MDVDSTAVITHSYDLLNRLVSSVTGAGTITYTYNAQGIRTSRTVGTDTTSYLLDGGNVIGEVEGDETYTYVRGVNLLFGRARYYLYNAHGDVVQLTNTNGQLTKNYNYDAFGNERSPDEEDANPFRYCGEYYDTETGLYYLRARYYDPLIGRFTQEDTHWNTANMIYGDNPQKINEREDALGLKHYSYAPQISAIIQSGNLYVYTANNPILYSDPTGNSIILTCIIVGAILGATAGGLMGHGLATKNGYSSSDGWDYWQYVAGCGIVGGVIGGLAGWAFSGTSAATAISWAYYKATTTIGASAYAIGRAFEKWFYKAYNIVNQQVSYAGYRLDAIHQSHIIELKNYTWSNYTNLSGLISRFTTQAANYLNLIGRNIAGQTIEGVVFYFSSQPPEKIIKALESLGVIVKWIP